ncbi:MAG: Dabb family protein [bacterium]|nr:Dabb family protein [bacterium]
MIKHIVMFRFRPEAQKDLEEIKRRLEALVDLVPELIKIEVGLDFVRSERSADLVLTALVEDETGLEAYAIHPAHQEVVQYIKQRASESRAVDYRL